MLFSQSHVAWVVGIPFPMLVNIASSPPYRTFTLPKRRGGERQIRAPRPMLKHVQSYLRGAITSRLEVSDQAHGFCVGRSIVTNAQQHVGRGLIAKFDIADFFGTIGRDRVTALFDQLGYASSVTTLLTDLCTLDGSLPQGAPTSPDLANAAARDMDADLQALAEENRLVFTRYADDMTFSGQNVRHARVRDEITRLVHRHGFTLNEAKTTVVSASGQQRVTGIVVNEKANWPRNQRRWLRAEIHNLERLGLDAHLSRQRATATRGGRATPTRSNYRNFIYGHVYALNSTNPEEARGYLERLDQLTWPGLPAISSTELG